MRPRSLDQFLRNARVPFTTFRHAAAFTAQEEAELSHVPGRSWAKTVICFADDEPIAAVVPAHLAVDLERLDTASFTFEGGDPSLGTPQVRLERKENDAFVPAMASVLASMVPRSQKA